MFNSIFILSSFVEKDPGIIVGTISKILGFIINFVFNIVYSFTDANSLGITIIIFTILVRLLMLPLNYKQQRSMFIMQKIQPELKKIQDKYKSDKKDPEAMKQMQMEITKLYSKYNCNPFSGCLPIFIQLPIFFALYFIMKNSYVFVTHIGDIYTQIASSIQSNSNYIDVISPIASSMTPPKLDGYFNITQVPDLLKYLSKFSPEQWSQVQSALPNLNIGELLDKKTAIETFLGLNLTETVGFRFPKVIIVILSALTTYLTVWITSKKSSTQDPTIAMQQKIMGIFMPLMMAYVTSQIPCGVGIYWIVGNLVQVVQQIVLNKYCEQKFKDMVI